MAPNCTNLSNQQLYLVGAATSITLYCVITSVFSQISYPVRRNLHILLSSIMTLICCIVAIYINLSGSFVNEDPVGLNLARSSNLSGLNALPMFLAILFASLAALHRYTSYLKDKSRVLVLSLVSGSMILFSIFCLGIIIFDVFASATPGPFDNDSCTTYSNGTMYCSVSRQTYYPLYPTFASALKVVTIVIPIIHILFGIQMTVAKMRNPPAVYRTTGHKIEAAVTGSLSSLVVAIWFIYMVVSLVNNSDVQGSFYSSALYTNQNSVSPALQTGGLLGPIYLVCHSFALLCESSIASSSLNLNGEEEEEEEVPKDNFFTTT
ncbi:hypothetical protein HDV03_003724 [Kappamyces sp. JEL0829]|nr:hypothetical protein HDV03_003724 [Kappamyces sp. JEL0829]KAJ3358388.1 hypothetical protein HDU91_005229 [Kappamyces sp. JEL0680]